MDAIYDVGKIIIGSIFIVVAQGYKNMVIPALIMCIIGLFLISWGVCGIFTLHSCSTPRSVEFDSLRCSKMGDKKSYTCETNNKVAQPSIRSRLNIEESNATAPRTRTDTHCRSERSGKYEWLDDGPMRVLMSPSKISSFDTQCKSRIANKKIIRTDGPSVSNNNK
jgi:hypothetical protein